MNHVGHAPSRKAKSAFLEYFQHWYVIRENLRNQLTDPRVARRRREMAHEARADSLALVIVHHSEGHLGLPKLSDDVTCAADDYRSAPSSTNAIKATWLMKSMFMKNATSFSEKPRLAAKKRRKSD